MIKLMKADLYRASRSAALYIALLIAVLMTTLCIMDRKYDLFSPDTPVQFARNEFFIGGDFEGYDDAVTDIIKFAGTMADDYTTGEYPLAGNATTMTRDIIGTNIHFYPMLMIVFAFLVSDFSNKTIKNTLSTGTSRVKYYISKLLMIEAATVVIVFIVNIYIYYVNILLNLGWSQEPLSNIIDATINQLPLLMGTAAMLTLLGVMVKKMSVFLITGITFIYYLPTIIYLTYYIYESSLLKTFIFKYEQCTAMMWLANFPPIGYVLTCAAIGAGEIIVSAVLGCLVLKKSNF